MELKLLQDNGTLGAGVQASPEVFEREYNEALVHQVVVAYQANARSGNRAQKDREQVKHTTKKPWRQKGTGRARAGMRSILSQLAREGRLNVVDQFTLDAPKTKVLADKVKAMGLDSVLIIVDQVSENLYLASRNLHKVAVCEPQHADPLALVQYKKVLVSKAAIAKIEELLK